MAAIVATYEVLSTRLDEATVRAWAAVGTRSLGRDGIGLVAKATGLSRTTIHAGMSELESAPSESQTSRDTPNTKSSAKNRNIKECCVSFIIPVKLHYF